MNSLIVDIVKQLRTAWRGGQRRVRVTIGTAIVFVLLAIIIVLTGKFLPNLLAITEAIAGVLGVIGGVLALTIFSFQKAKEEEKHELYIEQVKKRFRDNPGKIRTAWEFAFVNLDTYISRNLSQIRAIFWLTVFVMIVGFTLIAVGITLIYRDPQALNASVLSAASGVLVTFIGATFLALYKSTMSQAATYVTILERINAVGMSMQNLDRINQENGTLKDQTSAEIAKQILVMYSDKGKA